MNSALITIIVGFAMIVSSMLAVDRGLATIDGMVTRAAETAKAERDAYWMAEIAKSNEAVERTEVERAREVAAVNADAQTKIALAEREVLEVRKDNDALADDGSCGLSAGRVKLLGD